MFHYQTSVKYCDVAQEATPVKESRPLPQSRYSIEEYIQDLSEPTVIPEGKCSLRQALTFISQHKNDPTIHSSENIAAEYKIDKKVVGMYSRLSFQLDYLNDLRFIKSYNIQSFLDDILKHFKLYASATPNYPDFIPVDPFQTMIDEGKRRYDEKKRLEAEKKAEKKE